MAFPMISRSMFSLSKEANELSKFVDNPSDVLKEQKKKMMPVALAIKEMTETKGWKEVMLPFLERHGNANILFGKTAEQFAKLSPKIEAYHNLLNLVNNLLKIAEE